MSRLILPLFLALTVVNVLAAPLEQTADRTAERLRRDLPMMSQVSANNEHSGGWPAGLKERCDKLREEQQSEDRAKRDLPMMYVATGDRGVLQPTHKPPSFLHSTALAFLCKTLDVANKVHLLKH